MAALAVVLPVACGACHSTPAPSAPSTTPPASASTTITAFGDSITYGVLDPPCAGETASSIGSPSARVAEYRLLLSSVNIATSYPSLLQTLLADTPVTQVPVVLNEGNPGELATDAGTMTRLAGLLASEAPRVLLLQEGVNDVHSYHEAGMTLLHDALLAMVRAAQQHGAQVFIGTLLPERPGACRAFGVDDIVPANAQIRDVAAATGASLVDLYAAFGGSADPYIGHDGLHPNAAGYQKIADTFFASLFPDFEAIYPASVTPVR